MNHRTILVSTLIVMSGAIVATATGCEEKRSHQATASNAEDRHTKSSAEHAENAEATRHEEHTQAASHSAHTAHWSYTGAEGPASWGDLSPAYEVCKNGRNQSPVDILNPVGVKRLDPLEFAYAPAPLEILNNGHTIQVNYAPGSHVTAGGVRYQLLQFHFHSPSENQVKSRPFPLEMHLVHKDDAGKLAVVGVFFETGSGQPVLASVWEHMPEQKVEAPIQTGETVDANALLPPPGKRAYYHFSGSLTTPPCSEGVNWFVLESPLQVSQQQVDRFLEVIGANARPVQSLNGRVVMAGG